MILRFLVKFLLLTIILAAIAILTAQWKLERDLDEFSRLISPVADFNYESAKIGITGEVRINAISMYFQPLNTSVEIGELKVSVGNLYDLAWFRSNLKQSKIPDSGYITLTDVLVPFNPKLIDAVSGDSPPTSMDLVRAAYCGDRDKIGIREIEAMGYDYLSFSGREFFLLDKYSGSAVINGNFDIEEMFDVTYQVNIGGVMKWLETSRQRAVGQFQEDVVTPDLALFELRVKDKGFNLKRAIYCAVKENSETEEYYTKHVVEVEKLLNEVGIQMTEPAKKAYGDYIKPSSELFFFIQPQAGFDHNGLSYYTGEELMGLSGLRVSINDVAVTEFLNGWSGETFSKISQNVMQQRAKENSNKPLYQQVIITKEYQDLPISAARQFEGYKVRVKRDDGTLFSGVLSRTSEKSIWITQRSTSGEITVPVAIRRVTQFEVFK